MNLRQNFSTSVIRTLAGRVGWRCCFPNCNIATIGPKAIDEDGVIVLGEAAHIYAASPNGPRKNDQLTSEQLRSITNGIWMCRHHARMIDADHLSYSADTLKIWKRSAELEAYRKLKNLEKVDDQSLFTLVRMPGNIIFEAKWISIKGNLWTFEISNFILGSINDIRDFTYKEQLADLYVIAVETQGDGRLLKDYMELGMTEDGRYTVTVETKPKSTRISPDALGRDIAEDEDGDLSFVGGDIHYVSGIDNAKQILRNVLSTSVGDYKMAPTLGSMISRFYHSFNENPGLLNRLLKLDIARLMAEPVYEVNKKQAPSALNFVNRIINVEVLDLQIVNSRLPIRVKLEWGNGEYWEDVIKVYIAPTVNVKPRY